MSYSGTIRRIDKALDALEADFQEFRDCNNSLVKIISSNISLIFEDVDVELHSLVGYIQPEILEDVLEAYRIFNRCRKLLSLYRVFFENQNNVELHDMIYKAEEQYKELLDSMFNAYRQQRQRLRECTQSIIEYMYEYDYCRCLPSLLQHEFRSRCEMEYTYKLDELKKKAFTPADWTRMLQTEFDAMEYVAQGQTSALANVERFSLYSNDMLFIHSSTLVKAIREELKADNIYLFDTFHQTVIDALEFSSLSDKSDEQLDLLFKCVLRHNIIIGEIYPEKKREFQKWTKGERMESPASIIEFLSEDPKGPELATLLAVCVTLRIRYTEERPAFIHWLAAKYPNTFKGKETTYTKRLNDALTNKRIGNIKTQGELIDFVNSCHKRKAEIKKYSQLATKMFLALKK